MLSSRNCATARATALFRSYNFIGKLTGLGKNQAAISANQAARKHTGVDLLGEIGLTHLPAPEQTHLLNATDIGARLGGMGPQEINIALATRGYQVRVEVGGKKSWEATKKGLPHSEMQDTAKKRSNGTPIRQLKWKVSILDELADMKREPTPAPFAQTPARTA